MVIKAFSHDAFQKDTEQYEQYGSTVQEVQVCVRWNQLADIHINLPVAIYKANFVPVVERGWDER